jgi:hypothetical protein
MLQACLPMSDGIGDILSRGLLSYPLYPPPSGYDAADDGLPNASLSRRIGISNCRVQELVVGLFRTKSATAVQELFWNYRDSCRLLLNSHKERVLLLSR